MSAYNRGDLSLEAYLVRILTAVCKQNGGELRIKGELIDSLPESPTLLLKEWDGSKAELVLRTTLGSFSEVFKVLPEKQPTKEVIAADPMKKQPEQDREIPFDAIRAKGSTLDNEKLAKMEATLQKRRIASLLREDIARNNRQQREA